MIVDEAVYLEHVGVKGMHWGVRKANRAANKSKFQNKGPVRRKLVGVASVGAVGVGTYAALNRSMNLPARAVLGGGTALIGAAYIKRLSETKMHKQVRELRSNKADAEQMRQIEAFLKANPTGRTDGT